MTITYDQYADKRMNLTNVKVALDGYHSYNYEDHVREGGQDLTKRQSKLKIIDEAIINDARERLYSAEELASADEERQNLEFLYCAIDGVLQTMILTTKDIKADEQLFIYYGPTYGE